MGCTCETCKRSVLIEDFDMDIEAKEELVIALAGNPNVGKSTVFNALTGLKQHTGNWPGKTVSNARGVYKHKDKKFILVDLPGTYSLLANSVEEQVARDFICFGKPDTTIVVADATCLERNLNIVLQVMELTDNVVLCVNLLDEAKRKGIDVDIKKLEEELGIPVVGTCARKGEGLEKLMDKVYNVALKIETFTSKKITYSLNIENEIEKIVFKLKDILDDKIDLRWVALRIIEGDKTIIDSIYRYMYKEKDVDYKLEQLSKLINEVNVENSYKFRDDMVSNIYNQAEQIVKNVVKKNNDDKIDWDKKLDDILTSKITGYPIMFILLGLVFWVTVSGANIPSAIIADFLFRIEGKITELFINLNAPKWLHGILVLGMYRTLAWVISVMLPPMAIFFPCFTLLEDLGYLPRVAFNLDRLFKKAGTHGKQSLTMSMGFGCNAAGIVACRIIESPRERLIAMITNNFVPCNGRFPTLIAIASIFVGSAFASKNSTLVAAFFVSILVLFGIVITLIVSWVLSKTILKGVPSSFTLELPPYRKPQIGRIIYTSIIDRTIFVLGRAIVVAAPAGFITWIFANVIIADKSILAHMASFLQPFGNSIGLDGFILVAFILGFPANEIVIPILIMSYMSEGAMLELDSLSAMKDLFIANGWTFLTALNVMLFSLLHFPCGTTLWTIKKESGSVKWTVFAALMPTLVAISVCFITTQISKLILAFH
ncbi:ferrous iron transport protein B [Tepidibacter thalassicus]|uniref:Ferrous iron transport protein B n=1 Tax=Tepidibacter thalassicus DSM 15285 TaxID=1123350 RepID=A0A1M5RKI0_9FIRM|nr:ferrous iron transport protein B [Tepidibacter thalassicus]SHH26700.1 ferrous iron transport protein B [Tepidibacter thalassicus DSM 15285]